MFKNIVSTLFFLTLEKIFSCYWLKSVSNSTKPQVFSWKYNHVYITMRIQHCVYNAMIVLFNPLLLNVYKMVTLIITLLHLCCRIVIVCVTIMNTLQSNWLNSLLIKQVIHLYADTHSVGKYLLKVSKITLE